MSKVANPEIRIKNIQPSLSSSQLLSSPKSVNALRIMAM